MNTGFPCTGNLKTGTVDKLQEKVAGSSNFVSGSLKDI